MIIVPHQLKIIDYRKMLGKFILIAVVGVFFASLQCSSAMIQKYYTPIEVLSPMVRVVKTNLIGNRPTTLDSDGPETPPLPIIQAPGVTLPTVEGPIVTLPSPPIPAPRVLSERCICTKTVVKPQIIQRSVTVPKIERYLKRTYTPIIESIAYRARPKCVGCNRCGCCSSKKSSYKSCGGCYKSKMC